MSPFISFNFINNIHSKKHYKHVNVVTYDKRAHPCHNNNEKVKDFVYIHYSTHVL